jgi:hypothetical protein
MRIALGILALLFGLVGFLGQLVSAVEFRLAQRLGLQEGNEETEPLYRRLELNTARWDLFVLWTLPVAGVLMLGGHAWWPYVALVAGGVSADAGGRETAKLLGLRAQGIRIGSAREVRTGLVFLPLLALLGAALVVYSLTVLV